SPSFAETDVMQLCKVQLPGGDVRVGVLADGRVRFLRLGRSGAPYTLSDLLHGDAPAELAASLADEGPGVALEEVKLLPPLDHQEGGPAGVTYKRTREARERESAGAARFYDLVSTAARPELFFKATARRVVGPGAPVRIRSDARWSVPEPELALVVSPRMRI